MAAGRHYWRTSLLPTTLCGSFVTPLCQNYSLLNLASALTVPHLGVSRLSYFKSDISGIGVILSKMPAYLETSRLLSFIPSRYGYVSSITHATDCLIARLGQIVQA